MNVTRETVKNEMFSNLAGKNHAIPKESKKLHNLLASSQIVRDSKGSKLSKKTLCLSFGINYHSGKLTGESLTLGKYKTFTATPYTKESPSRVLVIK